VKVIPQVLSLVVCLSESGNPASLGPQFSYFFFFFGSIGVWTQPHACWAGALTAWATQLALPPFFLMRGKRSKSCLMWCGKTISPAFGKLRLEDFSSKPAWATHQDPVSKTKQNKGWRADRVDQVVNTCLASVRPWSQTLVQSKNKNKARPSGCSLQS
jgi:hypothetical protein